MNMKLVSVIIPIYNSEKYLEECLDSIINQTYRNLEILLVDDGSTDSSALICDKYAQEDKRITVFHVENGGVGRARNIGLENAKGDYIYFADSDDFFYKEAIESLLSGIEKTGADIAIGDYFLMDHDGTNIKNPHEMERIIGTEECKVISEETFWKYVTNCNIIVFPQSKLYAGNIWKNNRFKEGMINEDHNALPDIMSCVKSIVCVNVKLFNYRIHNDSIMHCGVRFKSSDAVVAHIKEIEYLLSKGYTDSCFELCLNAMRIMSEVKRNAVMNEQERQEFKNRYRNLCGVARKLNKMGDKKFKLRSIIFINCFPLYVCLNGIRS